MLPVTVRDARHLARPRGLDSRRACLLCAPWAASSQWPGSGEYRASPESAQNSKTSKTGGSWGQVLPGRRTRRTRASCETCDMRHHATRLSAVLSRATGHPPTSREFVCPRSAHPSFCGILPPPLSRAGVCLHLLIKSAQIVESGPRETGRRRKHPLPPPPSEGPLSPTAGRCAPARRIVPSSLIAHCVIGFVRGRRIDDTGGFEASVSLFLSRLCVQKRSTHTHAHTHTRTHTHTQAHI